VQEAGWPERREGASGKMGREAELRVRQAGRRDTPDWMRRRMGREARWSLFPQVNNEF
jgi:hypothetical protein